MRKIDTYLKVSTSRGKDIVARAFNFKGYYLREVYSSWSSDKQRHYDECFEMYANMPQSTAFAICSANTYCFSCSWCAKIGDEEVCILCTKDHTYCVYLER